MPSREPVIYQPLFDDYLAWMAHFQHAASGTLEIRAQYLVTFLRWLGPNATPQGMATLTADDVEAFFLVYAHNVAARRSMQSALRTFFRFCLHQGYTDVPLDLAVPTLRTYKLATVPRGLTEAQAQQVLQCVNRKTSVGRRNFAILQLLFTYGVRGGQVRALRLDQIDWNREEILFEPSQNGKASLLPLTREVGESLLDYLQNFRATSSYPSGVSDHASLVSPATPLQFSCRHHLSSYQSRRHRHPSQGRPCLPACLCHPNAPTRSSA